MLTQLITHWRGVFQVYRANDADSADIRARHLQGVMRLQPAMMAANLANGVLVVLALQQLVPMAELLGWLGLLVMFCAAEVRAWWHWRQNPRRHASPRAVHRAAIGAAVLALLWGVAVASWFGVVGANQRLLLSTLLVGLMCGGAFVLATLPLAAMTYVGVLTAASLVALNQIPGMWHLQALVMIYAMVLCWSALVTSQVFTSRLMSQREAARQGQLVGLLLRDFEEHAADLLWEVGADGRFSHVAPRLALALGAEELALQSETLMQVLERNQAANDDADFDNHGEPHLAKLRDALTQGRPFSDLEVPVRTQQGPRWWSFTAKPLLDHDGRDMGWRGVISDVSETRETHRQLAVMAHFDPLTGLANRVKLREHLTQTLALTPTRPGQASDPAQPPKPVQRAALVCLDVDHFKSINDTLGHAAGDAVLVAVAQRLRQGLRQGDLAARLGGDEFALVLAHADGPAELHALARRLVASLCQPVMVGERQVSIGVSLGLALAPDHGQSLDELMAHADLALYAAKEAGRGRHEIYVPRLGDRRRRRMAIEQGLRDAVARGELRLHWQPRVDIQSWQTVAAEALLRWQHPTLGDISPVEFVRIAEESGQIVDIGRWVLMQACAEAMRLPSTLTASINVSAAQLGREDFLDHVTSALQASGLPPGRLELEVTESLLIDAESVALRHLHALRSWGVRVALDDFGTGYSSLAYLRRFPFDTLKIDRAFVRELMSRHDARAIVKTIIELARTMGMHTLAEGVEEPAQLDILREAGCDAIQGYLVARPVPVASLCQLLANWRVQQAVRPSAPPPPPQHPAAALRDPQAAEAATLTGLALAAMTAVPGPAGAPKPAPSGEPASAAAALNTAAPSPAPASGLPEVA